MKGKYIRAFFLAVLLIGTTPVSAQDAPQVINIPLSKPGEPLTLDIDILSARIEVIGEDREDVEFTITVDNGSRKIITPSGTQELTRGAYSLEVDEEDNVITMDTDWRADKINVVARIPRRANLELSTTNNGEIIVSNVTGNLQLENTNGPITATNISGSVIAETVNQSIDVSFVSIDATTAMALSTMNGNVSLGLPSDAGVQLHIDSSRGEIFSDFEVDVLPSKPIVERTDEGGRVEVKIESVIIANVNGGGSVIRLSTLNGDIQIRNTSE